MKFIAVAAAGARASNAEQAAKVEDAGFCSDGCRQSYGRALLVTEPITQTERPVSSGEYEYEVVATETDGTELRFNYVHQGEPLGVGDTFNLRHGALDLRSFYRVTRMVSDGTVEAEWFMGGGPRYPDGPSSG